MRALATDQSRDAEITDHSRPGVDDDQCHVSSGAGPHGRQRCDHGFLAGTCVVAVCAHAARSERTAHLQQLDWYRRRVHPYQSPHYDPDAIAELVGAVAAELGVPLWVLLGKSRRQSVVRARQVAALALLNQGLSISATARALRRDRQSVRRAASRGAEVVVADEYFGAVFDRVTEGAAA